MRLVSRRVIQDRVDFLSDNLASFGRGRENWRLIHTDGSRCTNNVGPRNFQQIQLHPPHSSLSWALAAILPLPTGFASVRRPPSASRAFKYVRASRFRYKSSCERAWQERAERLPVIVRVVLRPP